MSSSLEISRMPAHRQRELVGRRELSPVDLARACLDRIESCNGRINALCTLNEEFLEEARRTEKLAADGGEALPLLGLPVGIKDVTPTKGIRTTYGSPLFSDHVPAEDALIVQRLRAAGAVVAGKTNTPEFAAGGNTFNSLFGATRNPWNPRLSAGGSTGGGAAALASGMISLAEGTDLGGSLRIPASFCGVVGLRPGLGLVPLHPTDYVWDTLEVTGPMARTAEDVALMLGAIAGPSPCSPLCQPVRGRDFASLLRDGLPQNIRLGYAPDPAGIGVEGELEEICRAAAAELAQEGARLQQLPCDLAFARSAFLTLRGYWMVVHQSTRLDRLESFGENLAGNVRAGLALKMEDLASAEQARGRVWRIFFEIFQKVDLFLTPCMAVPPFSVEQNYPDRIAGRRMETYVDWIAPTFVLSLTGLPVVSVPCGLDRNGLPVGLQIVGPPQGEELALALAARVQAACPVGLPSEIGDRHQLDL